MNIEPDQGTLDLAQELKENWGDLQRLDQAFSTKGVQNSHALVALRRLATAGRMKAAERLFGKLTASGEVVGEKLCEVMIEGYLKAGDISYALSWADKLTGKNLISAIQLALSRSWG